MIYEAKWVKDETDGETYEIGESVDSYENNADGTVPIVERLVVDEAGYMITFNDGEQVIVRNSPFSAGVKPLDYKEAKEARDIVLDALFDALP